MSRVKNQRTVPQSYLRRFTTQEEKIRVFDKVARSLFSTHVRNIASETGFYDFDAEVLSSINARLDRQYAGSQQRSCQDSSYALLTAARYNSSRMLPVYLYEHGLAKRSTSGKVYEL